MPYVAKPDDSGWGKEHDYIIDAVHARGLPGVICPLEGAWAITGINYPTVDVALIDSRVGELPVHPIPIEDYRDLVVKIEPITGPERPLRPGTNFGPLRGTMRGLLGDFAWVTSWTMLVRRSAYQELLSAGFSLDGAEAKISAVFAPACEFEDGSTEPLVELEARCKVALANLPSRELCPGCGRLPLTKPKGIVLEAASYDSALPLQRIVEMPTYLVVNDELGEFIRSRGFSNITLSEIELN